MLNPAENFPLASLTTLDIGGPAKYFIDVKDKKNLKEALKWAKDKGVDHLIIGGGSNLLIADQGIDKLVIKNSLAGISIYGDTIVVKSGTPLQKLVDFSINNSLAGLYGLTGIPGTVGGAIYGNAGAYGQTISDCLASVIAFDQEGEKEVTLDKKQCQFGYRNSGFKKNSLIILEATFKLKQGDKDDLKEKSEEIREKRLFRYPPGLKCPGSFFKNILAETLPKDILKNIPEDKMPYGKVNAGYLLESVGAKGEKEGDIEVSEVHGNLFVNKGEGKAEDFYKLAKRLALRVKDKFNLSLEPEVQLINLPPLL